MLINNITELKEYLPASVTFDFKDIRPKIRLVEREIIQRIFSAELYNAVTNAGATGELLKLRDLLSEAVAHLALQKYLPFGQVQIDSAGIRIAVNDNMKTAFEWQVDNIADELIRQGWSAVESALEFLEKTTDPGILTIWTETETYQSTQTNLITNMRRFEKYVNIGHSRILFNKLSPVMQDQQDELIIPTIGQELFDAILTSTDALYLKVRKAAEKALAYKTMAVGFMDTLLVLSDNGPLIIDGMISAQPKAKKTAPESLAQIISENYKTRAAGALKELLDFCQANAEQITEFHSSANYISPEADYEDHIPRNDPSAGLAFF